MLPFLLKPYATQADDALHHLFRLFALDQAVSQGDVYPLRFPGFSYGYGAAVLSYYPPLSYYLMEALHLLGADYVLAYKVAFTVIVLGAALSSYYLAARIFGRPAAVVVSVAYLYNPYFLANIWRRGAAAETLALAVAPLLFAAIHRVAIETSWRSYVEASLAVALIILAHPLSTFLFAPFLAGYAILVLVLLGRGRRGHALMILVAGVLTGALLTCFYWLPAQLEPGGRRAVDLPATLQAFMEGLKPIGQVLRLGWTTVFRIESTLPDFSIAVLALVVMSLIYFVFTLRQRGMREKAQFVFFAISAAGGFPGRDELGQTAVGEVDAHRVSAISLSLVRPLGVVRGAHHRRQSSASIGAGRLSQVIPVRSEHPAGVCGGHIPEECSGCP